MVLTEFYNMSINLEKDEYIIYEVRKHWFILLRPIFFALFAVLLPVFIYAVASALPIEFKSEGNIIILFLFLYSIWALIVWIFIFVSWTNYYLDVWILTNKNLIDVEQIDIFHREIATMRLAKIQDITSEVRGFLPTFLNFGSLKIQTSGLEQEFIIHGVENPNQVREQIEKILSQYVEKEGQFSTSRHIA